MNETRDFRDEVLESLRLSSRPAGTDDIAGVSVPRRLLAVSRWSGSKPYLLGDDCRKEAALLVNEPSGEMSCIEVEVVRQLRENWSAGWVQGFRCGWLRWGEWIWKTLPAPVAAVNERVQIARGERATAHGGHPDVAVTDGKRVVYIECKMLDSLKDSQIEWFSTAFARKIITPNQVTVVQGVD